ncbi:MAG TPA: alkaline phosphatase family protein, partial [Solirubrobacteraceae bacterium]|nr:alkaline phosphatase family protein [Solirubrobacteraceae bacterium]
MAGEWIAERGWVAPEYGGDCFAALPGTITQLLCGSALGPVLPAAIGGALDERYERVVLVYFDAFSLEIAERHAAHPLLARAARDGQLARLTSQFPSTTTVHMTTIHTGAPVGEHGLYEWFVLEPSLERLIAPLPFAYAGDGGLPLDLDPAQLYPRRTIYEWLAEHGAQSAVLGSMVFAGSPTSRALLRGASEQLGFLALEDGLAELAGAMRRLAAPAYGFAYIDALDTLLHKVGPGDTQRTGVDAEIELILDVIERALLDALPPGTLVLLTADHGMTPVSPTQTIYLNSGDGGERVAALVRRGREPGGHPL